jgi:predicted nucleic acid-binding Zn ribbon protein
MVEEVNTGGMMRFVHSGKVGKLNEEDRRAIQRGYAEAEERKKRERKNKIIIWMIIVLLILTGIWYVLLR